MLDFNPLVSLPPELGRYFFQDLVSGLLNPEFKPLFTANGEKVSLIGFLNRYYQPLGVKISYSEERLPFNYENREEYLDQRDDFFFELVLKTMGFTAAGYVIDHLTKYDYPDSNQLLEINFPQLVDKHKIPCLTVSKGDKTLKYYFFALADLKGEFHKETGMFVHKAPEEKTHLDKVDFNYTVLSLAAMFTFPDGLANLVHEIDHMVRDVVEEEVEVSNADLDPKIISEGSAEEAAYEFFRQQQEGSKGIWPNVFDYLMKRRRWKTETSKYRFGYRYSIGGLIASAIKDLLGVDRYFKMFYQRDQNQIQDRLDLLELRRKIEGLMYKV